LREAGLRSSDHEIAESGQLGAAADGWTVYDAENRLADLQHGGERGLKRIEHLVDTLRGVFADVDAAAENLAGGIDGDELHVITLAGENDAVGNLTEHGFVEEVVIGAIEGEAGDAGVHAKFYEFEIFGFAAYGSGGELLGANRLDHAEAS